MNKITKNHWRYNATSKCWEANHTDIKSYKSNSEYSTKIKCPKCNYIFSLAGNSPNTIIYCHCGIRVRYV